MRIFPIDSFMEDVVRDLKAEVNPSIVFEWLRCVTNSLILKK